MDLDGDGQRDVISGSWPGQLYVFLGKADGTFAKARTLKDKDGDDIEVGNATVPFVVDWEGDGDLDLLVGDILGQVHLLRNESGDKRLQWGDAKSLMAEAQAIRIPGGDSGPVVVDWDADGRHDLIVGAGDGSVLFFKNLSRDGAPLLRAADTLVPASKEYPSSNDKQAQTSPCGSRAKIATADWNADGKLDLLLGDFGMGTPRLIELTEKDEARRDELKARLEELNKLAPALYIPAYNKVLVEMGYAPIDAEQDEDGNVQFPTKLPVPDKRTQEFSDLIMKAVQTEEPIMAHQKEMGEVYEELGGLEGRAEPHGHVWVFLRK